MSLCNIQYFSPPLDYVHLSRGEDAASLPNLSVSPGMADLCGVSWCSVLPRPLLRELWNGKENTTEPETANEGYANGDR